MIEEPPEASTTEKASEAFSEASLNKMVGRYTLVIVGIIAAGLICMGFGWPWFIAGLGPIVLIPLAGVSFAMVLDIKIKKMVN